MTTEQREHKGGETIVLAATASNTTMLSAVSISADTINLSYNTMPDNRPNTYGNFVAIWQNANQIPYNQAPLFSQQISKDTQRGSVAFTDLTIAKNDYIIGYSVGPVRTEEQTYGNVCATVYVPLGSDGDNTPFWPSVQIKSVLPDSLVVGYKVPSGNIPGTNKAWLALWRSETTSYTQPPLAAVPITSTNSSGTVGFNNVTIGIGLTFTVGLFMSGWATDPSKRVQRTLACSASFDS